MATLGKGRAFVVLLLWASLATPLCILSGCARERRAVVQCVAWPVPSAGTAALLPGSDAGHLEGPVASPEKPAGAAFSVNQSTIGVGSNGEPQTIWDVPEGQFSQVQVMRLPPVDTPGWISSAEEAPRPSSSPLEGSVFDPARVGPDSGAGEAAASFAPDMSVRAARLHDLVARTPATIWGDYGNFYAWPTMRDLLLGISVGSVLANTSLDQDFRDWYAERVHTPDLNRFGLFWRTFGEGAIFIPSYVGLAAVGAMCEDVGSWGLMGEFGARVTRGYAVGSPPLVFGQLLFGGSRPSSPDPHSYWTPFEHDNGISGHAFIGAMPFLTAARMAEGPWWKGTFYCLSVLPGWSRIEGDKHYLSQVFLGWWMAYLASRAVDQSVHPETRFSVAPMVAPGLVGVNVACRL